MYYLMGGLGYRCSKGRRLGCSFANRLVSFRNITLEEVGEDFKELDEWSIFENLYEGPISEIPKELEKKEVRYFTAGQIKLTEVCINN